MGSSRIAVITAAHRQHELLLNQVGGLTLGTRPPDLHVVIAMSDQDVSRRRLPIGTDRWETVVKSIPTDPRRLPVAAARNLGASLAREAGADVLVFLDAGCIPGRQLVELYADNVLYDGSDRPAVWSGGIAELPSPPESGYRLDNLEEVARPRADLPVLLPGQLLPEPDLDRFTGSSFACSTEDFALTEGFHEEYLGYGGADLDYAQKLRTAGGSLTWLGGATAYHQLEELGPPSRQQIDALVRSANLYRDRWGGAPSLPHLDDLASQGLAQQDDEGLWQIVVN